MDKKITAIILLATLILGAIVGSLVSSGYLTSDEAGRISEIEKTVVADLETAVPLYQTIVADPEE